MVIVEGAPVAKGRPRMSQLTGKAKTPQRTLNYERIVQHAALDARDRLGKRPVLAIVTALHPIPKGWSKAKTIDAQLGFQLKVSRPDVDNLLKSVFDGMQPISFDDDSQIEACACFKGYSINPRVEVELFELSVADGVFRAMNDETIIVAKTLRGLLGRVLLNDEE